MPRMVGSTPVIDAHNPFELALRTLNPATSCSMPNTSTLFALRPAAVLGTSAHDRANGAAASVALRALPAALVVAVADVANSITAAPTPARIQTLLCIDP